MNQRSEEVNVDQADYEAHIAELAGVAREDRGRQAPSGITVTGDDRGRPPADVAVEGTPGNAIVVGEVIDQRSLGVRVPKAAAQVGETQTPRSADPFRVPDA